MDENNQHVLVVEDSESYQMLFADKLSEEGFDTTVVGTKAEAKEKVATKPDIILLDYTLPDGTGEEILKMIRGQDSQWSASVPVLMFTQHDDPEKIADSVSAGAQAYMVKKDITVSEVVEKTKQQLDITN